MIRRARWIVLAVAVLLIAAVLAGLLLVRPDLADARDRVDARWDALRAELTARYDALSAFADAFDKAGASERTVTRDLHRELNRWTAVNGAKEPDRGQAASIADELEALARRAEANRLSSDRLKGSADLLAARNAYFTQVVSPPNVQRYNRAVKKYEATRDGAFERIIAGLLGFSSRPKLLISGAP